MKKFTTKLLMSIIAVAFAFVALGTSTYAWFAMNNSVNVNGLEINAKSNSVYLLIGKGDNDTYQEIQAITPASRAVDFEMSGDSTKVYPAAHGSLANAAAAATASNWYYKVADLPTAPTSNGAEQALTTFENYVIRQTVYVTLAKDSLAASNLKVSASFTQTGTATGNAPTIAPIRVLVCNGAENKMAELSSAATTSETVLAATVTDTAVVTLDIYIYIEGNNDTVYTTNFSNLDGANIALAFSVDSNN